MGGPAVWWEITKTPREPFISKFEMEDKSSSAAAEHQHKVTHNRFRTDPPATPWKMEFSERCAKNSKKKKRRCKWEIRGRAPGGRQTLV